MAGSERERQRMGFRVPVWWSISSQAKVLHSFTQDLDCPIFLRGLKWNIL